MGRLKGRLSALEELALEEIAGELRAERRRIKAAGGAVEDYLAYLAGRLGTTADDLDRFGLSRERLESGWRSG